MAKLAAFTILFTEKSHGKTRSVQFVIIAKNPFKTSIDTYKLLPNFLKILYHKIFVCWPYSLMARAEAIMLTIPCNVLEIQYFL